MIGTLLLAAALSGPARNVALLRPVEGRGLSGTPELVTSGRILADGTPGTPDRAALLADERSVLVVPLGSSRRVRALVLQCEADDEYLVERSLDGRIWTGLLRVEPARRGAGLQMQAVELAEAPEALYLAVHARGGDGRYAVSQLQVFETLPTPWPPQLVASRPRRAPAPARPGTPFLTEERLVVAKGLLAVAGILVLAWGLVLDRTGRGTRHASLRDALLASLGALGFLAFWSFGHFHGGGFLHVWDGYHYVIGAKYFPELSYTRLYACSVAADLEEGRIDPDRPVAVTDLVTNEIVRIAPRAALAGCRPRFTETRWRSFVADVSWFREREGTRWYPHILKDHGYNATPAWGILGRLLASAGPVTLPRMRLFAGLDIALLCGMWIAVWWAFGWRAAAVAVLFWGTGHPWRFFWNGGSFLRMDWLAFAVVGACLLRKERPRAAGALLAFSALLRVFPGVLLLGLAAAAAARWLRERRVTLTRDERGLLAGAALAIAVVVPLSLVAAGAPGAPRWGVWGEFVTNSRKHLATPLTNNMGLKTLLASRLAGNENALENRNPLDPWSGWKEARRVAAERTRGSRIALALAAVVLFAFAFRGKPAWTTAAGAAALLPFLTELTCYYYSAFVLLALLAAVRRASALPLLAFSALSAALPSLALREDDLFALVGLLAIAAGSAAAWLAARIRGEARPASADARSWNRRKDGR